MITWGVGDLATITPGAKGLSAGMGVASLPEGVWGTGLNAKDPWDNIPDDLPYHGCHNGGW